MLLRPVQRQIEFGQPRRRERDGLPALQDRLDQLRAQEGEANETANVAPGNAVTLGQLLERPSGRFFSNIRPAKWSIVALSPPRSVVLFRMRLLPLVEFSLRRSYKIGRADVKSP